MKNLNNSVLKIKESIFTTMTKKALEFKAINLSQGFPDFDGPKWVLDSMKNALDQGHDLKNQYAPSMGAPILRDALAKNYEQFYQLKYDPSSEIVVTNGATEAIFCSIMALLNPGDEVIVFEPFYDSYKAAIELSGGAVVPVTLHAPNFELNLNDFKKAITNKTKLVILNNPHNPTGKMFSYESLLELSRIIKENDLYVISDEVYEFLTYEKKHIPFATLPEMFERTITISSSGKTFGFTGFKIGWAASSKEIISAVHNVHQFNVFCVHHPSQLAMAEALIKLPEYLPELKKTYGAKRELLLNGLSEQGYKVIVPDGAYFILVELDENQNDIDFCLNLIAEKKVASIPVSAFYLKSDEGKRLVRFCFAKKDETLKKALESLAIKH